MIDTHAHLDSEEYNQDRDEIINEAFNNGIENIIVPAINPKNFDNVIKLTENYDKIYCGIGIHPHDANSYNKEIEKVIYNLTENSKVVAIGEIGLDYYYNFATPEVQKIVFKHQLKIAKETKKPVIIHNRDSDNDLLEILKNEQNGNLTGVLHCFSGNTNFLRSALELGFYVSFTGNITFKKFDNIDTLIEAPLDRIMIETDSPYMTPAPFRGKRNKPSFVKLVAEKISEVKRINIEEVIKMTTHNAKKLFNLTIILISFLLMSINTIAQSNFEDDEKEYDPYKKFIGVGLVISTNTIVEYYEPRDPLSNVSYEGLFTIGGTAHYSPIDYIVITGTYLYSKNNKLIEKFEDIEKPNIHQQIELTSNFIVNPHGRINFFGMVGFSYLMNEYQKNRNETLVNNNPGINTGLGFYFNLPISGVGLVNFVAEWKLNFMLGVTKTNYDPRIDPKKPEFNRNVEFSSFFSMPRISIILFPNF